MLFSKARRNRSSDSDSACSVARWALIAAIVASRADSLLRTERTYATPKPTSLAIWSRPRTVASSNAFGLGRIDEEPRALLADHGTGSPPTSRTRTARHALATARSPGASRGRWRPGWHRSGWHARSAPARWPLPRRSTSSPRRGSRPHRPSSRSRSSGRRRPARRRSTRARRGPSPRGSCRGAGATLTSSDVDITTRLTSARSLSRCRSCHCVSMSSKAATTPWTAPSTTSW